MKPLKITIFSDYICPFCFLAKEVMKRVDRSFELDVEWKSYELHPVGEWMPDINSAYIRMAWLNVQRIASENHIDIKLPSYLCNSRRALELAEVARGHGENEFHECHERIFKAYFLEGKNIEKENVLLKIGSEAGLEEKEVKQAWKDESFLPILQENKEYLHDHGITGVPTFFIGSQNPSVIFGLYPQEKIEKVIRKYMKTMQE
ncbi:MAG: DsbA family oxidoreductase [Candidatus Helarchaeota archaeon]